MLILGKSHPYIQNAISSGLESVSQGIVQTTQQQGIEALDKAINTFSISEFDTQQLLGNQSQISAPADFSDPTSVLGNQEGTGEVLTFLRDSTFRAGSELNNFSKYLSQEFAHIQTQVTPEQAASLNNMKLTLGRMSNLQQSLDAQLNSSRLGGVGFGLLQNSQLQKAPDRYTPEMTFSPSNPIFDIDNLPVAPKASNLFVKDGSDVNEIDVNDVEHFRSGPPNIMASIAAVARQDPDLIKNMIRENTDGTYTVTFPSGRHVTVTDDFTTDFEAPSHQNEIWPLVIEKAVRQTTTDHSVPNILNLLTGQPVTEGRALTSQGSWSGHAIYQGYLYKDMKKDFDSGKAIVLISHGGAALLPNSLNQNRADPIYAFTVSNLYADDEGNEWVELQYPGQRPPFLPENPVPFDQLMELYRYSYTSQAHMKGTNAIEAETNVNEYAQIRQEVPVTEVNQAKTTNTTEKAREIK